MICTTDLRVNCFIYVLHYAKWQHSINAYKKLSYRRETALQGAL